MPTRSHFSAGEPLPRVSIVVINWNGKDHLLGCLESISRLNYPASQRRVLVVDNSSTDGSPDLVRHLFPDFQFIINPENYGCARAENQGIQYAIENGDEYVWLLNNDVVLEKDSLRKLIRAAESDSRIAVLAPAIYSFQKPHVQDHIGYRIDFWTGRFKSLTSREALSAGAEDRLLDVDSVQGCAALMRVSVCKHLGGYYAAYVAYFEESEFHVRVRREGYRVVTVIDARIWHKKAASYNRVMLRRAYLLLRNLLLFEWRNAPKKNLTVFIPYFICIHLPYFLLRGSFYALNHMVSSLSAPIPGHSRHSE